jgi:hypothetical protein
MNPPNPFFDRNRWIRKIPTKEMIAPKRTKK